MQEKSKKKQTRCPVCNKFGNKKNPMGRCNKCDKENKAPKCIIGICDEPALEIGGTFCRHCKKHHFGEGDASIDLFRKSFETDYENRHPELPEQFEIVSDKYPIER